MIRYLSARVAAKEFHCSHATAVAIVEATVQTRPAARAKPTSREPPTTAAFVTAVISISVRAPYARPQLCPRPHFVVATLPLLCSAPTGVTITLAPSAPNGAAEPPPLKIAIL